MTRYQDGGEALLESFRALEIDHIFCSSGSEWAPLWEAMTRQKIEGKSGPEYHDFMHETLAVDMAIGYTIVTGRMQAVLLHAVPGLLQGSMGIHAALLSEMPILVFSSEANSYGDRESVDPGSQWYRNLSIVGGPHAVVNNIVKWSCQIPSIETFYEFTKRAGEIAQRQPRGPVYLNAPVETLLEAWEKPKTAKTVVAAGGRVTPQADLEYLAQAIAEAKNPIIITESVGRTKGGLPALVEFAESYSIPVYEPQSNISCNFPKSHPLYMGGNVDGAREDTDLILLINCRSPWYPPSKMFPHAKIVVIDEVPQRPQMVYQVLHADRYLEGDVMPTLLAAAKLAPKNVNKQRLDKAKIAHEKLEARWLAVELEGANADGIDAVHAAATIRECLPEDYTIFDESITHSRIVQAHIRPEKQGSYSYVQGGLGQGIGVALGGKLGNPDRFTMLTIGDGAFLYNPIVQSLSAAREMDLAILIVIFNNKKYLSMKYNHMRFYPDGQSKEHEMFHGVDLDRQPALETLGEACGVKGIVVADKENLKTKIIEAIRNVQNGQTTILNIHVIK